MFDARVLPRPATAHARSRVRTDDGRRCGRPRALILAPTRELAGQIRDEFEPLTAIRSRSVATFYGGTNIRRDIQRLRRGVDIAVATPGRLADLVRRGDIDLRQVTIVVVDEADRMADMGFLPEVRRLLDATSPDRQTLLFSATLDGDVDVLIRHYQRDPVRHEIDVPIEQTARSCTTSGLSTGTTAAASPATSSAHPGPRSCSHAPSAAPTGSPDS